MDEWWFRDDGEAIGPVQSPDEIFGTLLQDIDNDKHDHFLQGVSDSRQSNELMNTDYKDLETILYNRATCESPKLQDDTNSSHSKSLFLSPERAQSDQNYSRVGSTVGSEVTPWSPKGSQGSPNNPHEFKLELCLKSDPILRQTPTPPEENEQWIKTKLTPIADDRCVSDKKSNNEIISIETNTSNTDDILNSFLAQCSAEDASGLLDEISNLPKSCSPTSSSIVPPIGGYVTPPWSPDFPRDVLTVPTVPVNGEVKDVIRPRHTSEGSYLATRPLLDVLTSCKLSNSLKSNFQCQFCAREFKHKIGLKNHERSHLRGETHVCGYCGKSFRYKNKLRRHVNVHAREMRICRYCGEVQANDYDLVQHEKKHKNGDKKLIDEMMDSSAFTNNPCSNLDIVFTEGKSFTSERLLLPLQNCQEPQPWTLPYRSTALVAGTIQTFPKQVR